MFGAAEPSDASGRVGRGNRANRGNGRLDILADQVRQQLLGRIGVRRALGDSCDEGSDTVVPVPSCPPEEDVNSKPSSLIEPRTLNISVGHKQLAVADLGLQLAGGEGAPDIVGLRLSQIVLGAGLPEPVLQQDQHRGAVAGVAWGRVLQLPL